jgi:hypothetical protein
MELTKKIIRTRRYTFDEMNELLQIPKNEVIDEIDESNLHGFDVITIEEIKK